MPKVDFAVEARLVEQGILVDLVEVTTWYCEASYGLLGPPIMTEKKLMKLLVPAQEVDRRVRTILREGNPYSSRVEQLEHPFVNKKVEAFVAKSLKEGCRILMVRPAPMS